MKEIILVGSVGLSGTKAIIEKKYNEIREKYPERVIRTAISDVSCGEDISGLFLSENTVYAKQLGEGGFFAGLWYMSKEINAGFTVDMRRVPIIQEAVEICEMFGVNPYILESGGAWLAVSEAAKDQSEIFEGKSVNMAVIGRLETSNDKKLLCGERVRFLDRPAPDELRKIL